MIERNLGNATDKQIKADQSLAKADYINMWHLLPLADPYFIILYCFVGWNMYI